MHRWQAALSFLSLGSPGSQWGRYCNVTPRWNPNFQFGIGRFGDYNISFKRVPCSISFLGAATFLCKGEMLPNEKIRCDLAEKDDIEVLRWVQAWSSKSWVFSGELSGIKMLAPDLSDVTLALVDANVLACWESKVKLGLECSLLLKHSEGKSLRLCSTVLQPFLLPSLKLRKWTKRSRGERRPRGVPRSLRPCLPTRSVW